MPRHVVANCCENCPFGNHYPLRFPTGVSTAIYSSRWILTTVESEKSREHCGSFFSHWAFHIIRGKIKFRADQCGRINTPKKWIPLEDTRGALKNVKLRQLVWLAWEIEFFFINRVPLFYGALKKWKGKIVNDTGVSEGCKGNHKLENFVGSSTGYYFVDFREWVRRLPDDAPSFWVKNS